MKVIFFLIALPCLFITHLSAQPKPVTHHLLLTIFSGPSGYVPHMIITKEDGTQEIRKAENKKSWLYGADLDHGRIALNEDSLMVALKPFFDAGWNLSTSNVTTWIQGAYVTRYFFTKQE